MKHDKDTSYQDFPVLYCGSPPDLSPEMYLYFRKKYGKGVAFVRELMEWGFSRKDAIKLNRFEK